jgi:hypothetical protein
MYRRAEQRWVVREVHGKSGNILLQLCRPMSYGHS